MQYESIMRHIMDAAIEAHQRFGDRVTAHQIGEQVKNKLVSLHQDFGADKPFMGERVFFDNKKRSFRLGHGYSPNCRTLYITRLIRRDDGLAMTVALIRDTGRHKATFADIMAGGLLRIRTNHRVLVWRSRRLGDIDKLDHDIFTAKFVEGDGRSGHKNVPPFVIGDLTKTDQALRYLLSCWAVTGRQAEHSAAPAVELPDSHLFLLGQQRFPAMIDDSDIRGLWSTDMELTEALNLGPLFVSEQQAA